MPGRKKQTQFYTSVVLAARCNSKVAQFLLLLLTLVVAVSPTGVVAFEDQRTDEKDNDTGKGLSGAQPVKVLQDLASQVTATPAEASLKLDSADLAEKDLAAAKKITDAANVKTIPDDAKKDAKEQKLTSEPQNTKRLRAKRQFQFDTELYTTIRSESPARVEPRPLSEVEESYLTAKRDTPEDEKNYYYALGRQAQIAADWPTAINHFTKSIESSPHHRKFFERSKCYVLIEDFAKAHTDASEGIKLNSIEIYYLHRAEINFYHLVNIKAALSDVKKSYIPGYTSHQIFKKHQVLRDKIYKVLNDFYEKQVVPLLEKESRTENEEAQLRSNLDSLIDIDDENILSRRQRCQLFMADKSWQEAIDYLTPTLSQKSITDADKVLVLKMRAECYQKLGEPQLADKDSAEVENIETKKLITKSLWVGGTLLFLATLIRVFKPRFILDPIQNWMNPGVKKLEPATITEQPRVQELVIPPVPPAPPQPKPVSTPALTGEQLKKARREAKAKVEADAKAKADAEKIQTDAKATTTTDVQTADVAPVTVSSNLMPDPVSDEQDKLKKQLQDVKKELDTKYAAAKHIHDDIVEYYKNNKEYLEKIREFSNQKYQKPLADFQKFNKPADLEVTPENIYRLELAISQIQIIKTDLDHLKTHVKDYIEPQIVVYQDEAQLANADAKLDAKPDDNKSANADEPQPTLDDKPKAKVKKGNAKPESEKPKKMSLGAVLMKEKEEKEKEKQKIQEEKERQEMAEVLRRINYNPKHPYNFNGYTHNELYDFIIDKVKETNKDKDAKSADGFENWGLLANVINICAAANVILGTNATIDININKATEISQYSFPALIFITLRHALKHVEVELGAEFKRFVTGLLDQLKSLSNKKYLEKLKMVAQWIKSEPFFIRIKEKLQPEKRQPKPTIEERCEYLKMVNIPQIREFIKEKGIVNVAASTAYIMRAVEPFDEEWQKTLTDDEKNDPLNAAILLARRTLYGVTGHGLLSLKVEMQLLNNAILLFNKAIALKVAQPAFSAALASTRAGSDHKKYSKPRQPKSTDTSRTHRGGGSAGGPAVDAGVLPAVVRNRKKPPPPHAKPKPAGGVAAAAAGEAAPLVVKLRLE